MKNDNTIPFPLENQIHVKIKVKTMYKTVANL